MHFFWRFACVFVVVSIAASSFAQQDDAEARRKALKATLRDAFAQQQRSEERRKQLDVLLKEHWEYTLRTNPVFASTLGDRRYNDKLGDASEAGIKKDLEEQRKFLARFEKIETAGFPEQEQLNKALMVRNLRQQLDNAKFQEYLMPVNQFTGIHIQMPQVVPLLPYATVKDYEDYITRLNQVPKLFDDVMDRMQKGRGKKLMPPKILLERAVGQAERIAAQKGEDSPFAMPLKRLPKEISEADKRRLSEAMLAAIDTKLIPAYEKLTKFLRDEYIPHGRPDPGMWSLPDGAARYAARAKNSMTIDMEPEAVHQLGLREVARIEGEMLKVAQKLGFKDLKSFNKSLETNKDVVPKSREHMLELYRKYTDQMYQQLPKLFGRLPKAKMEVHPVEQFREKEAAGASYQRPAPDGSRPGRVMVNTGDVEHRRTLGIETTAYHEGVPGHHMQLAIAQELPALPPFRQQGGYTAYVEGWALYSERLGREVGFFQDLYSFYGHLQDEMLRAIRLVVDTGLHYKKWSRQQVVDFFHDHSAIEEPDVQAETDRYIAIPGQALGYKIGQLKILELREKAQKELGSDFDLRAFHDEVLGAGPLPLEILEQRISNWIARVKSSKAA